MNEQALMNEQRVASVDELPRLGKMLLSAFADQRVFVFFGEMGVGKTTFIKALCREIGVEDLVSSPTFSIVNEYISARYGKVYHFDFYRINKLEEVFDLGYEHYFYSGNYCFVEWPEKLGDLIPEGACRVYMREVNRHRLIKACVC